MFEQATDEAVYHGEDAVERALAALTVADLNRLRLAAGGWLQMLDSAGRSHEDLLSEALTRTLEGIRRWRRGVDFIYHLNEAMRSIVSSWRKTDARWTAAGARRVRSADLAADNPGISDPLEEVASGEAATDAALLAREAVRAYEAYFAGDRAATAVLAGWREGLKGPEIMARAGMPKKDFQAAVRRIRRTAQRGGPERVD